MKKFSVCAITMVKDDLFFLRKWIEYYGKEIGLDNLFVISHGADGRVAEIASGANVIPIPAEQHDTIGVKNFESNRFALINGVCNGLVRYYDYVIFVDVDEFIIVDPKLDVGLKEYIHINSHASTITPFGLDVIHKKNVELNSLVADRSIFSQRKYCLIQPLYSKPAITRIPIIRSIGNHNSNDKSLYFGRDLYLFHLKWVDYDLSMETHYARHMLKTRGNFNRSDVRSNSDIDFPLKRNIDLNFQYFSDIQEINNNFDFSDQIDLYKSTWRKRRYLAQKDFWKCLLRGNLSNYSFHWRFDLVKFPGCFLIPERFTNTL